MSGTGDFLKKCFALTGAIGTGKSAVASMLAEMGAHIIDTDLIAREVVEPGQPALRDIEDYFGKDVIHADGTLNREKVREQIIRDPEKRNKLNSFTHPRINRIVMERIGKFNGMNDGMPIIIDVPLLYESGWDRFFPDAILVYVPVALQVERLMARDRLDRHTAELTIAAQMSIEDKKGRARFIVDNSGTLEETRRQVAALFEKLRAAVEC
ncbi:MAG TPA: dephospho-CoA kinase [Spirochaetota bacterium]|nr:dephospho-CoA kinase [Spirochaetota bacterium]HPC41615.1 dephospho-CoA kinase [Spirochaetota bacterium]HPL15366.1 dephospho-CoA kinase [Spirochaetota bacterium]HQF08275.1 dephospho-CoA kinase [Spirochaetota bacterium]HQH97110.1 dephospho-CoA kinase [Spirochaetota bacterium]